METTLQPISETLFLPLAARAKETKRDHPVITDAKAAEILQTMNLENTITDGGELSTIGILARTKVIDEEVLGILSRNPTAVILNLGAGLDTRIFRIDNGLVRWYDLDLPEVIRLRSQYFCENERVRFLAKSVFDPTWTAEIDIPDGAAVILIAEGLLMYFSQEEVRGLLALLSQRFPGAHMFFDVVHSYFINKKISSTFTWGMDNARDIEKFNPNIRLLQAWSTGDLLKERQSRLLRMLNFLPATRNRSQILHIQFQK